TETQHKGAERLIKINVYRCAHYLCMSAESRRSLEITESARGREKRGSLLWAIDRTESSMGKRLLRSFLERPLTDPEAINKRLDAVSELYDEPVVLAKIKESLKAITDIDRLMTRIVYNSCTPRDMAALAKTSRELQNIKKNAGPLSSPLLVQTVSSIDDMKDIAERIEKTISDEPPAQLRDGGYIKNGFSSEVDELRELLHNNRNILSRMERGLKESTGIRNLKIGYNKVFGYYIEVSRSNAELVPGNFVRKQTLTGGERYITEELKTLENKILGANERLNVLERALFEELRLFVETEIRRIQRSADAVSLVDVLCAYAALAQERNYTRPAVDGGEMIIIKNGRHPVVELINRNTELFVPNDTLLGGKSDLINIITGPNMSGKSTYMRQTALIVMLAQMGSFVPAKEARIGVVDAIFTRIGASDDLFSGDSTFMIEMKEIAYIFSKATKKSLLILDEVGRGTSTYDGMSIARAVIERIAAKGGLRAKTMFATHYHELTVMDREFECVRNYNIAAKKIDDNIVFMRRIVHGPSDDSFGIEVAKLAGVPEGVIERAKSVLRDIELRGGYSAVKVKEADSADAQGELLDKLKGLNVENLTPLEAMFTLNELAEYARRTGE
ncbi:MAG: DNA mismatch repair protein MutS, partial [Oscillospiraceae bacterium]|nr:DNA mismatch repair protein MutS [Oscillospiraceae bacterium]